MSILRESVNLVKFVRALGEYKRSGVGSEKQAAAQHLAEIMGDERGLFLKIGQLMGSDPQAVDEFQDLLRQPKMFIPIDEIIYEIEHQLQLRLDQVFKQFSEVGVSASLGQVHKAVLLSGESVAVKVQMPNIEEALNSQMKLFGLLPMVGSQVGPGKKWGIDLGMYRRLLSRNFKAELNYTMEAENQIQFAEALGLSSGDEVPWVIVPKVYKQYLTEKILVSEWVDGKGIAEFASIASVEARREVARNILRSFLQVFLVQGYLQADYNSGNFLITQSGQVAMLDFGSCYSFGKSFRLALAGLVDRLRVSGDVPYRDYFCALGFDEKKILHLEMQLPWIGQILFEPFLVDRQTNLREWKVERRLGQLLGDSKWWFRSAGGSDFFILLKAFAGLVRLIEQLDVDLNFYSTYNEIVCDMNYEISQYRPPAVAGSALSLSGMAEAIEVQVLKSGETTVDVSLPAKALADLPDYLDDALKEKIKSSGVEIEELIRNAISSGARAQVLFELDNEDKSYRVQLK